MKDRRVRLILFSMIFSALAFFILSCDLGRDQSVFGRYMAPPPVLSGEDIIQGPILYDYDFEEVDYDAWYIEDDQDNEEGGRYGTSMGFKSNPTGVAGKALRLSYTLGSGISYRYVNIGVGNNHDPYTNDVLNLDASAYDGIAFSIRGSSNEVRFNISTENDMLCEKIELRNALYSNRCYNWDLWGFTIEATPIEWTEYILPFDYLYQWGWGVKTVLDTSVITKLIFEATSRKLDETGWFAVDQVYLFNLKE